MTPVSSVGNTAPNINKIVETKRRIIFEIIMILICFGAMFSKTLPVNTYPQSAIVTNSYMICDVIDKVTIGYATYVYAKNSGVSHANTCTVVVVISADADLVANTMVSYQIGSAHTIYIYEIYNDECYAYAPDTVPERSTIVTPIFGMFALIFMVICVIDIQDFYYLSRMLPKPIKKTAATTEADASKIWKLKCSIVLSFIMFVISFASLFGKLLPANEYTLLTTVANSYVINNTIGYVRYAYCDCDCECTVPVIQSTDIALVHSTMINYQIRNKNRNGSEHTIYVYATSGGKCYSCDPNDAEHWRSFVVKLVLGAMALISLTGFACNINELRILVDKN